MRIEESVDSKKNGQCRFDQVLRLFAKKRGNSREEGEQSAIRGGGANPM